MLTREAFWNVFRPGCVEHYVLNHYRSNQDFIPELDFVMEEDGRIIGHVMYSKAELTLKDGSKSQLFLKKKRISTQINCRISARVAVCL